jgi:hypothetical protein
VERFHQLRGIRLRANIALAVGVAAFVIPMVLDAVGLVHYRVAGVQHPLDVDFLSRLCVFLEWMLPACFVTWSVAYVRLRHFANDFGTSRKRLPALWVLIGVSLLAIQISSWVARPYSGEDFGSVAGWEFGVAYFFLSWAYTFRVTPPGAP